MKLASYPSLYSCCPSCSSIVDSIYFRQDAMFLAWENEHIRGNKTNIVIAHYEATNISSREVIVLGQHHTPTELAQNLCDFSLSTHTTCPSVYVTTPVIAFSLGQAIAAFA